MDSSYTSNSECQELDLFTFFFTNFAPSPGFSISLNNPQLLNTGNTPVFFLFCPPLHMTITKSSWSILSIQCFLNHILMSQHAATRLVHHIFVPTTAIISCWFPCIHLSYSKTLFPNKTPAVSVLLKICQWISIALAIESEIVNTVYKGLPTKL